MKKARVRLLLLINGLILGGLFFLMNQEVSAQWILRNATAVYPVAACRDGVYIGVGTQTANVNPVSVTGELLPGGEVLFSQLFTLTTPSDPNVYPFLELADFYFVTYNPAYAPLTPGQRVDLNPGGGIEIIATVGDCYINPAGDPLGVAFTYQGRLDDDGTPANGTYDLRFRVYDAAQNGNPVGVLLSRNDLVVADGLFTTDLNFGSDVFTGDARWLEISVRPGNSGGAYTPLTPRQEITAVPYALGLRAGAVISGTTLVDEGILTLKNNIGEGLVIERAHNGVIVKSTASVGMLIQEAAVGLSIEDVTDTGVEINTAEIGVSVGTVTQTGVYVSSSVGDGVVVYHAGNDGLYINEAGNASSFNFINNQNDGIEISNVQGDGIYIAGADDDGIHIASAGDNGLVANGTSYAAVFQNNIFVNGGCTGCKIVNFGLNESETPLQKGDIVAVVGVTEQTLFGEPTMVLRLKAAEIGDTPIGVVADIMEAITDKNDNTLQLVTSNKKLADADAFLTIITYGLAQVKVSSNSPEITVGERVTLGEANRVRALQTAEVNGIQVAEDAPTLGTALEDFAGAADGLLWILINPR